MGVAALTALAEPARLPDLEAFLLEQLEAIADELFARYYQPRQAMWSSADCPWCRRMLRLGLIDDCPVCSQIQRSRTDGRSDSRKRNQP